MTQEEQILLENSAEPNNEQNVGSSNQSEKQTHMSRAAI